MKLTENYELRHMAGEYVLIPKGEFMLQGREPLVVNEMIVDIMKTIGNGADTAETIAECLTNTYNASYEVILSTVQNTLKQLTELTVIA